MNLPIKTPIAQHEPPIVAGSIEPITNRTTKQIIGYRGRLPRSMSTPPKGCKNPATFREWATPLCATRAEAIVLLNTVIEQLRTPGHITRGRTFADCAALDIEERYKRSRQRVNHHTAANKRIQCWRNIVKNWLPKAQFWEWTPAAIQLADCQAFVNWLETRARFGDGEPLSASMVRNIIQQMRSVFRRAGVNPEASGKKIQQPPRKKPKVPNLSIAQQCRFFSCKDITIEDRIMAGIGMGLAVRVGELLAIEHSQIKITSEGRGFVILEYGGDHHAPLKGKGEDKQRKIELHEPGLGFLKIWLRDHYKGGVRLFEGPKGGYMSAWANKWKPWTKLVGCRMHSHLMRHTYAVSMLSGTWGYGMQDLGFVKKQLGHTEIRTTEKYYADYHEGSFTRGVDQMVESAIAAASGAPKAAPVIVTAVALLNSADGLSSGLSSGPGSNGKPAKQAGSHKTRGDRWSTHDFPGNPGESADKAACDGPVCQSATAATFPGRFQPRRRRKIGGVA